MRIIAWGMLATLGLWAYSGNVSAADKPQRTPEEIFKRLDANSDGKLTVDEFMGKRTTDADKAKSRFAKVDANGDGSVSLEELKAAFAKKKAK